VAILDRRVGACETECRLDSRTMKDGVKRGLANAPDEPMVVTEAMVSSAAAIFSSIGFPLIGLCLPGGHVPKHVECV
jgi:hypothetical protein